MGKMNSKCRHEWIVVALLPLLFAALVAATPLQETSGKPDDFSAAIGRQTFQTYCASCHGTTGVGDGNVAQYLRVKPTDLTTVKKNNGGYYPFKTVVEIIDGKLSVKGHGHGEMPVWGDAFTRTGGGHTDEEVTTRIDQLTHYIWSIQKD